MGCVYPQVISFWSDYPRLLLRVASLMPLLNLFTRERGVYPQVTSLWSDYPRLLLKCVSSGDFLLFHPYGFCLSVFLLKKDVQ